MAKLRGSTTTRSACRDAHARPAYASKVVGVIAVSPHLILPEHGAGCSYFHTGCHLEEGTN